MGTPTAASYTRDKLNRFWIDTLGTLEPGGLNKKRREDVIKSPKNYEVVPFVMSLKKRLT